MKHALLLLSLTLSACSLLEPQPSRLRHFVLDVPSTASPVAAAGHAPRVRLGIGPLALPDYLRRAEIVRRVADHQVRLQNQDRWAEPLELGLLRVLVEHTHQQRPDWLVVRVPGPINAKLDIEVPVEVMHFEDDGSRVQLSARWGIKRRHSDQVLLVHESTIDEPLTGGGTGAAVAAMGRAAARLAVEISTAVDQVPEPTAPPR